MNDFSETNLHQNWPTLPALKFPDTNNNFGESNLARIGRKESWEMTPKFSLDDFQSPLKFDGLDSSEYYKGKKNIFFPSLEENESCRDMTSILSGPNTQITIEEGGFGEIKSKKNTNQNTPLQKQNKKNRSLPASPFDNCHTPIRKKRVRKQKTPSKPIGIIDGEPTPKKCSKCLCKNSQCVKLYCECFAAQGYCSSECGCNNCLNIPSKEKFISFLRMELIEKNPVAFHTKYTVLDPKLGSTAINSRGCNCTKTMCLKNYCECFNAGIACSEICGCLGCANCKTHLGKEDVDKYRVRVMRKRKKTKFLCDFFFTDKPQMAELRK